MRPCLHERVDATLQLESALHAKVPAPRPRSAHRSTLRGAVSAGGSLLRQVSRRRCSTLDESAPPEVLVLPTLLEATAGKEVSRAYSTKRFPGMLLGARVGAVVCSL
jgi:hypothetical protein